MKSITELHNKHKNQEVWIVGSDPSLDDYPDNFLDDKIGITLHLAYLKYPDATYRYFNEYDRLKYLSDKDSSILEKSNIYGWPLFGSNENASKILVKEALKSYYLLLKPYPPTGNVKEWMENNDVALKCMKERVKEARNAERTIFGGYATCLHACLYSVIMMGANPINIIGCNLERIDDKEHFEVANEIDKKMRNNTHYLSEKTVELMKKGAQTIIDGCNELNTEVNWIKNYNDKRFT